MNAPVSHRLRPRRHGRPKLDQRDKSDNDRSLPAVKPCNAVSSAKRRRLTATSATEAWPASPSNLAPAIPTNPHFNNNDNVDSREQRTEKSWETVPNLDASRNKSKSEHVSESQDEDEDEDEGGARSIDIEVLNTWWRTWIPTASCPQRDSDGTIHFIDHPAFTPNKSPEEMIREGCFGGSYFRPLYSRKLDALVESDWQELPASWISGLNVQKYLTSTEYDPEINKYRVACGQSIEQWETAGWINHRYDVRGWFQWYCRFYLGRRCEDDERQISRWNKCVGQKGRWRRALLKKYVALGIRSVTDEGDEDDDTPDVSPVVHQTCHHWGWEVKQSALDAYWIDRS